MTDQPNQDVYVPLYFVGTVLGRLRNLRHAPVYNVKGRIYHAPVKPDGSYDIGAVVRVNERDVDELINKSRVTTNDGQFHVFTRDAETAAGIKTRYERGDMDARVPVLLTLDQTVAVVAPEVIKRAAADQLTVSELEELLAQKRAAQEAPEVAAAEEAPVEEEKPAKRKPVPPPVVKDE